MDGRACYHVTAATAWRGWVSSQMTVERSLQRAVIVAVRSISSTTVPAPLPREEPGSSHRPRKSLVIAELKLPMSWDWVGEGVCLSEVAVVGGILTAGDSITQTELIVQSMLGIGRF